MNAAEAEARFSQIFAGEVPEADIEELLVELHRRGETADEILGAARAAHSVRVSFDSGVKGAIDTCGTGGDGLGTFNVSTAVALAAAAAGITVVKHGNRASSSKCGSADVLEVLGVQLERDEAAWREELKARRFAFLFAPKFHPSFKIVGPLRKRLKHRTIFNLLGPLLNPADVTQQVLGVFDEKWVEPLAHVLLGLGRTHALVVHGGLGAGPTDEIAPWGKTRIAEVKNGEVRMFTFDPGESGAQPGHAEGGDAAVNAGMIREVLAGKGHATSSSLVALNLAAAMVVAGRAASIDAAIGEARAFLHSGEAARFWHL